MTEDEIEKLATHLAEKLQTAVTDNIYRDAGKNLIGGLKKLLWAIVIAIAAWGLTRYGAEGHSN